MHIHEILEYNRTMWQTRCNNIAENKTATHEMRQCMDISRLYSYLKQNPDKLPMHTHHYLEEHSSFFERAPLDNILMWQRGVEVSLNSKNTHRNKTIKNQLRQKQ